MQEAFQSFARTKQITKPVNKLSLLTSQGQTLKQILVIQYEIENQLVDIQWSVCIYCTFQVDTACPHMLGEGEEKENWFLCWDLDVVFNAM